MLVAAQLYHSVRGEDDGWMTTHLTIKPAATRRATITEAGALYRPAMTRDAGTATGRGPLIEQCQFSTCGVDRNQLLWSRWHEIARYERRQGRKVAELATSPAQMAALRQGPVASGSSLRVPSPCRLSERAPNARTCAHPKPSVWSRQYLPSDVTEKPLMLFISTSGTSLFRPYDPRGSGAYSGLMALGQRAREA